MYVLDKLWRDGISPSERYVRPGSEYQKASTRRNEEMERLLELLSPEAKAQMDVVETLRYDLTMLSEEDVFIYGFRLGARLMLDIMGEHVELSEKFHRHLVQNLLCIPILDQ